MSYELIITEKPQAAMKIAYALADIAPVKRSIQGVPYYEIMHKDKQIVVACAVGHLFGLREKKKSSSYPVFDIEWKQTSENKKTAFTKKYAKVLDALAKKASSFVLACDYDIEGELIGWNVLRFLCNKDDAKRMKFSTLTKEDIIKAYENSMSTIDWGLAYAGETRHFLDFYYGINLSRALMSAMKKAKAFKILSIGRVQGPALALIVEKEKLISVFKSRPYWQVFLLVSDKNKKEIEAKYPKDLFNKKEAEAFNNLEGKKGTAATEKKEVSIEPPIPFDLTTLQTEAYKFFSITPAQLLQIAQRLYLAGLISYPRTSSQKLPSAIGYDKIISKLKKIFPELTNHVLRKIPVEGKKSDPAHPSIYPTGEKPQEFSEEESRVYELIVRRFLSCFCENALLEDKRIIVRVEDKEFSTKGSQIRKKGWLDVYLTKLVEKELPDFNGEVLVKKVKIEEKETQPPRRYTPASLVAELTKRNLGTKSTRALIIETLYNRQYVDEKSIKATALGMSIANSLEKHCPMILDEKLTRKFEKEVDEIQSSKNGKIKQEKILKEAQKVLKEICEKFKKQELEIGNELVEGRKEFYQEEKEKSIICPCPVCKKGSLRILKSRFGKQFLACSAYPECKTTFSLPQFCLIKKTDKTCDCGMPLLMAIRKAKKPWIFCFNPQCKDKQQKQEIAESSNAEQKTEEQEEQEEEAE